jgi:hypothetical protein
MMSELARRLTAGLKPGGNERMVRICSICGHVMRRGYRWKRLATPAEQRQGSHGYCRECRRVMQRGAQYPAL